MKGRKHIFDNPVQKNFTIDLWMSNMIDECKKVGIRPIDIIQAGLISILQPENKLPAGLMKSFLNNYLQPKSNDLKDTIEYFEKYIQKIEAMPDSAQQKKELSEMPARAEKWFDSFHALKVLESTDTEKYILLLKSEYLKKPELFEIQDDNLEIDWNKLPKYYSIEAVQKVHSQNGSLKEDVPA